MLSHMGIAEHEHDLGHTLLPLSQHIQCCAIHIGRIIDGVRAATEQGVGH